MRRREYAMALIAGVSVVPISIVSPRQGILAVTAAASAAQIRTPAAPVRFPPQAPRDSAEGSRILTAAMDSEPPAIAAGNPATAPLKWAGLWLWTEKDGSLSGCTAEFITPRVILLAAHCIKNRDTGQFYDTNDENSGFLLQYQNHESSKVYHAVCKATWRDYAVPLRPGEDPSKPETMTPERQEEYKTAYQRSWQWDYGFVLLDADSITGHYNYSINTTWNHAWSTGYPGKLMGGQVIQEVEGDVFNTQDLYSQRGEPNVQVLWHGNPGHTQGASGGAWVVNPSAKVSPDTNVIVGLNSFDNGDRPGASFGPVLTDDFQNLLRYTANGCK